MICVLCFLIFSTNWLFSGTNSSAGTSAATLNEKLRAIECEIDFELNSAIQRQIINVLRREKNKTEHLLGLEEYYFPTFHGIFERYGVPKVLASLSVVESGLNCHALSPAGAKGMWQFMKGTAPSFGLRVNSQIDERTDFYKSTVAAARFLTDLHARYGDWLLAMAAYNCGPGRVNKAIRQSGSRNFWKLSKYLPRETRNYVPRIIAEIFLHHYYEDYGYYPTSPDLAIGYSHNLTITEGTDVEWFAYDFDIDLGELYLLNPHLLAKRVVEEDTDVLLPYPQKTAHKWPPHHPRPPAKIRTPKLLDRGAIAEPIASRPVKGLERVELEREYLKDPGFKSSLYWRYPYLNGLFKQISNSKVEKVEVGGIH